MKPLPDQRAKILIVDDSPENLRILSFVLESPEYEISTAENGQRAVELAQTCDFDLVLMDVDMPEMNGFEAASRMGMKLKKTPLIFMTAHFIDEDSAIKGYAIGAADYLLKPFSAEALKKKVAFFVNYPREIRKDQRELDAELEREVVSRLVNPLWAILLHVQLLKRLYCKDRERYIRSLSEKLDSLEGLAKRMKRLLKGYKHQKGVNSEISESVQSYTHSDLQ